VYNSLIPFIIYEQKRCLRAPNPYQHLPTRKISDERIITNDSQQKTIHTIPLSIMEPFFRINHVHSKLESNIKQTECVLHHEASACNLSAKQTAAAGEIKSDVHALLTNMKETECDCVQITVKSHFVAFVQNKPRLPERLNRKYTRFLYHIIASCS